MKRIIVILSGSGVRGQLWKRAWFASAMIVLVALVAHAHSSRMLPDTTDDVLALAYEQQASTQQVVKGALRLDMAVSREDYDAIEPTLAHLIASAQRWQQVHESLMSNTGAGIDDPLARLVNPHMQIDRGIDELLLVGRSAERRAPYLDSETVDRISRASVTVGLFEERYGEGLIQIMALRQEIVDARTARFRSSSRMGLLVLVGVILLCTPIVVFPALTAMDDGADADDGEPAQESAVVQTRRAA